MQWGDSNRERQQKKAQKKAPGKEMDGTRPRFVSKHRPQPAQRFTLRGSRNLQSPPN